MVFPNYSAPMALQVFFEKFFASHTFEKRPRPQAYSGFPEGVLRHANGMKARGRTRGAFLVEISAGMCIY